MIGIKKYTVRLCLAFAALLLTVGCSSGLDDSYLVRDNEFTSHKEESTTYSVVQQAKVHTLQTPDQAVPDDSRRGEIKYVAKNGEFIRITPEKQVAARIKEVLPPIATEFNQADTVELLAAFIEKYAPNELAFVALKLLAKPAIDAENWAGAMAIFEKHLEKFPAKNEHINSIVAVLAASAENIQVTNLGQGVNTAEREYSPVISSDGRKIYFARDCGECNGGEEVYVSRKGLDGNWGSASLFGEPLSSRGHEIPLGISADGNTLAVYGHYDRSLGRGDIFYVEKNQNGWGQLQHYPAPINSENFESNAMYTADGQALLFVSDRSGGIGSYHPKGVFFDGDYAGNTDIYVYLFGAEGKGEVINLGSVVNTPYAEYSPFLHPDGKTLYFSSVGHAGLGGLDVFKVTRLNDDSWTEWSEPVNLGKEVNTSNNDWGYQVAADGEKAYFAKSSFFDSYGGSDIFAVNLPEKARPSSVITVSGVVTDPNGDPLVADIRWDDLSEQKEVGFASSDPITGEYLIHLPYGANYGYYADKSGYIGESEHFDLREYAGAYKEYVLDIILYPVVQPVEIAPVIAKIITPMVEINMNNIFFAFDKADLQPESFMEMKRWVEMLQENAHIHLQVNGHADSVGSETYNQKLSERRARAVVNYLVANGIGAERLVASGYGESQPVSPNSTAAGRQQNRRVQVRIINPTP